MSKYTLTLTARQAAEISSACEIVARLQMAHAKKNKTDAAYNHAQYLAERTRMMQDWADYIYSLGGEGKVVPIRTRIVAL